MKKKDNIFMTWYYRSANEIKRQIELNKLKQEVYKQFRDLAAFNYLLTAVPYEDINIEIFDYIKDYSDKSKFALEKYQKELKNRYY